MFQFISRDIEFLGLLRITALQTVYDIINQQKRFLETHDNEEDPPGSIATSVIRAVGP